MVQMLFRIWRALVGGVKELLVWGLGVGGRILPFRDVEFQECRAWVELGVQEGTGDSCLH